MKRLYIVLVLLGCMQICTAQSKLPVYLEFPSVPPFTLTELNSGKVFSKQDLKKKWPVLIFVFDPACDHCINVTKEMLASMHLFKKVQIVMSSTADSLLIRNFYNSMQLNKYDNIITGMDKKNFLVPFYNLATYPGLFLYDKKGKFIKELKHGQPVAELASGLKK